MGTSLAAELQSRHPHYCFCPHRRVITETGRMLLAFMLGAFATVASSYVAMQLFPLTPWLGDAGWVPLVVLMYICVAYSLPTSLHSSFP